MHKSLALTYSKQLHLLQSENGGRCLNQTEIFDLIDVHLPYYALMDVCLHSESVVTAKISPEHPIGKEVNPIASAEAYRHLATLGSVSCAMVNPIKSKHYYLARKGAFKRVSHKTYSTSKELILVAECISFEKEIATIRAYILDGEDDLICGIDISFQVIPSAVFAELFANTYQPFFPATENPFTKKNQLSDIQLSKNGAKAFLGKVSAYDSGHFLNHPALPIAILLGALLDLCVHLIHHTTNSKTHIKVREFTLLADNHAFAEETIFLHVIQENYTQQPFKLRCTAQTDTGKSVGDVTAIIDVIR
ncbi:hypothetical protein [Olivibacter domesticus]|nr:hypothetical protein [Olivibacter domesticus]